MTAFVVAAAVVVAVVLVLLMRPFFRKLAPGEASRAQLNAAIYRDQFAKLDQDLAEGTLGQSDYAQARAELQRRVLEDNASEEAAATVRAPRKTMIGIALAVPVVAGVLYLAIGNPGSLQPGAAGAPGQMAGAHELDQMVTALAAKLEKEPTNYQGWAMLGRSYKVMGRNADAEKAFERAGSYIDNDAQALAAYADVVATNAGGSLAGKPTELINKALKADPLNPMALWLSGTADFEAKNYPRALETWEKLVAQLPPGSDDARMLEGAIADARSKAGLPPKAPNAVAAAGASPAAAGGPGLSGVVEIDPSLKARARPDDVVMVIARIPGTRMPLAVLRKSASELPMQFTLDDSLSMNPQAPLSSVAEIEIDARISKTGMAKPEPGDLVSAPQTAKLGAKGIALKVAKVLP